MPAACAEDVLLVVFGAEADDVHDEQARLRPEHRDVEQAVQQHADDDRNGQRVALVALVLPVQPDDLADVD